MLGFNYSLGFIDGICGILGAIEMLGVGEILGDRLRDRSKFNGDELSLVHGNNVELI